MPPSQINLLSRRLLPVLLGLSLGGTISCVPDTVLSKYGFKAVSETGTQADAAWALIADNATKTYGELAMLNFAARQLQWEIRYTEKNPYIRSGILFVNPTECLADSALLPMFAAIASNILGRNEIDAADRAAMLLRQLCVSTASREPAP